MAIWLKVVAVALLLTAAPSGAQELVKVPVQIPAITPAVTALLSAANAAITLKKDSMCSSSSCPRVSGHKRCSVEM